MKRPVLALLLLTTVSTVVTQCTEKKTLYSEDKANNYKIEETKADKPSPFMILTGTINSVDVVINYGSPSVRNRIVWGELVPFDSVWRTGANEATTIEFAEDVLIEGKELKKGKYGLFTFPKDVNNWTFIFNSVWDQWGAYDYEADKDVLHVDVQSKTIPTQQERLNFLLDQSDSLIAFQWDSLQVGFKVTAK